MRTLPHRGDKIIRHGQPYSGLHTRKIRTRKKKRISNFKLTTNSKKGQLYSGLHIQARSNRKQATGNRQQAPGNSKNPEITGPET